MQKFVLAMFLLFNVAIHSSALAAEVILPAPTNLQRDAKMAAHINQPIVVLFSLPGCAYCKEVRENYLAPILKELPVKERPLILEVDITGKAPFTGFAGKTVTNSEFASQFNVKMAPTVMFLDEHGNQVAEPLIGAGMAGFYGAYLDKALESSRKALMKNANYQSPPAFKLKTAALK